MNREILFKAKRKNWRELPKEKWWVEGYYMPRPNSPGKPRYYIVPLSQAKWYEIDPETLCQYTGLHDGTRWEQLTDEEQKAFLSEWNYKEDRKNRKEDWNGKRIWENDILKGFEYPFFDGKSYNYFALVEWVDKWKYFCLATVKNPNSSVGGISEGNTELFEEFDGQSWEVIGNVFDNLDNPELLGGAE